MNLKVFLTGASGRIGKRVLRLLLERGYSVRALIHHNKPEGVVSDNFELIQGDLSDQEGLKKAVKGCQIVCHLAASFDMFGPAIFEKDNNQVYRNIIEGTYNLIEATNISKELELFLYASTDAVFNAGFMKYEAPITEEVKLSPKPGRFYAIAKILGESLCINYGKSYDFPWSIIRINWSLTEDEVLKIFEYEFWSDDLSPEDRERLDAKLANGKGVFAPLLSSGDSAVDQIADSEDTAEGFVLAIDKYNIAKNNIFNIAGPEPFRYLDVIEKVAKGLGVVWDSAEISGIEPYKISNEKAKRMLGYHPKYNIESMIEKALAKR